MAADNNPSPHDQQFTSWVILSERRTPAIASWLVRKSVAKNLSKAKNVIIGLIIFDFIFAAAIIYFFVIR